MKNSWNAILIGFMFIFIGAIYLLRNVIDVDITAIVIMALGICFLVVYIGQNKKWALVPSVYLIYFSVIRLLFENTELFGVMSVSMFFIAPAIIFAIMYIANKKSYLLTGSCLLFAIGLANIFAEFINIPNVNILLLFVGLSLVISYLLSVDYKNRGRLYLGGLVVLFSIRGLVEFEAILDIIVAVGLILMGSAIIVKTIINNKKQ